MKKILAVLVGLFLASYVSVSQAQESAATSKKASSEPVAKEAQVDQNTAKDAEIVDAFTKMMSNQPELTQSDIDFYLKALPLVIEASQSNPAKAKLEDYLKENNISRERFSYIATKISVGIHQIDNPDDVKNIPAISQPTKAEQDLIKKNQKAIKNAAEAIMSK